MKTLSGWVLVVLVALGFFASGRAQEAPDAAATMTPGGSRLLVNKSIGPERWSISVNLANTDGDEEPHRIASITGNVFAEDGDVSFVYCQVRPDSTGSLDDPDSTFRLTCKGTGPCDGTALACARTGWTSISRDVPIKASFFLPPGGLRASGTQAEQTGAIGTAVKQVAAWIGNRLSLRGWNEAHAQQSVDGATLSIDLLNHLVVRDRGTQRWAIAFNFARATSVTIGVVPVDVTGNVYDPSGSPAFVYCVPLVPGSVSLDDPDTEVHLRCFGAGACEGAALDCAEDDWTEINADIPIAAGFFLPDDGRGSPASSESGLLVLGGSGSATTIGADQIKGAGSDTSCDEGDVCEVDRIGLCENVRGRKTNVDGACRCLVAPLPSYCTRTGTEAKRDEIGFKGARIMAACGAPCEFEVGVPAEDGGALVARKARGVSLPHSVDTATCFCQASPAGNARAVGSCGGPSGETCSDGRCCVDDPRDGCHPLDGDLDCAGICIAGSTDDDGAQCGTSTVTSQLCGDGTIQGSELCDPGSDPAATCGSLGFESGELACTACRPEGCSGGNVAPTLERLDMVGEIDKHGRKVVHGQYFDADGDAAEVLLTSTTAAGAYYVIDDPGRRRGSFTVAVGCNGTTSQFDFDVDLVDAEGNQSIDAGAISVSCVEPQCGDGTKQAEEGCDFASEEGAASCDDGLVCRDDCTCGPVDSCAGRCCPSLEGFCGFADLACRCDAECRERGDCCGDARAECGL